MTDERIDILVTDDVSPKVASKLRDIAQAAMETDTALNQMRTNLASLDTSAIDRMAQAYRQLGGAQQATQAANAQSAASQTATAAATKQNTAATQLLYTEMQRLNNGIGQVVASNKALANSMTVNSTATTRAAGAITTNTASQYAAARASRALRANLVNLSYQFNDIAVGLASGQKPFTVFIQQGAQILPILAQMRASLGSTSAVLRAIAAPFLAVGGAIATVTGAIIALGLAVAGGGIYAMQKDIQATTGVAVTFGDTFKGLFVVLWDGIKAAAKGMWADFKSIFLDPFVGIVEPISRAWDGVLSILKSTFNGIVGLALMVYDTVVAVFKRLPGLLGDIFIAAYNVIVTATQNAINTLLRMLNAPIDLINTLSAKLGTPTDIKLFDPVSLDAYLVPLNNVKGLVDDLEASYQSRAGVDYANSIGDAWSAAAVKIAKARMADEEAKKKGAKQKTFSDVLKEYDDEIAKLQVLGVERDKLAARMKAEEQLHTTLSAAQRKTLDGRVEELKLLKDMDAAYASARGSVQQYLDTQTALQALMEKGKITQAQYTAELGKQQVSTDLASARQSLGGDFATAGAIQEAQTQAAELQAVYDNAYAAQLVSAQEYATAREQIQRQLAANITNIQLEQDRMIFESASSAFGQLADATKAFAGEQSGIYKAMFLASKAFAIAESIIKIQQGIANAAALPFPANLGAMATVAAATASIVSTIASVKLAKGGHVSGPGSGTSDSIPAWLSDGEFVVNAAATKKNRALLEAINSGGRVGAYRRGGAVNDNNPNALVDSQMSAMVGNENRSRKSSSGGNQTNVTFNINTPDAQSFARSQSQIAAKLVGTVNRGRRNL